MPLTIHQFPCLTDNYGFLVRDEETGVVATIDTPDGEVILREAQALGWSITLILNTHWHWDHTGGNLIVQAVTGATAIGPAEVTRMAPLDRVIEPGDVVHLGATRLNVLDMGGHTLGQIAYHDALGHNAFVADAIFAMGCGRLFEGTPEKMWASLQRLAALPPETRLHCAHEYTAANARFALSLDNDPQVTSRARAVFAARERGEATVPTTVEQELATNPFLRAPVLRPDLAPAQAFGALRKLKDGFAG